MQNADCNANPNFYSLKGLHVEKRKIRLGTDNNNGFAVVEEDGKPIAIFARPTNDDVSGKRGGSNAMLASKEDMEYFSKYPLQQASFCLDRVMKLLRDASIGSSALKWIMIASSRRDVLRRTSCWNSRNINKPSSSRSCS
jgi:hypothetical protein